MKIRSYNDQHSTRIPLIPIVAELKSCAQTLRLPPLKPVLLIVANREKQLSLNTQIADRLREYSAAVRQLIQGPPQELAIYVRTSVPEELQKLIFRENRGLDATTLIEKAALEIYEGKRQLPEPPRLE